MQSKNHIFTTLLVIAFAFLFGSNAQAQKYDKAGIKAAIVNAGVPEKEVTQDMVDKYYNFCLESMDNEDKFEKEILPKLSKPYVVKELLNAGFQPYVITNRTWRGLKYILDQNQSQVQSLSEKERKEIWQSVSFKEENGKLRLGFDLDNLTPEEKEQKNTARLAELPNEMPELQAFFSMYAEKYAETAAKQKDFREKTMNLKGNEKYRNPDFSAYLDLYNEDRVSKGEKEITEFSNIDDFLRFLDMYGFKTYGVSSIDFRQGDGTWKEWKTYFSGKTMTKAQTVVELERLYNEYKKAVFEKYDVRERGNIIRFKFNGNYITTENGKITKFEPSSLPGSCSSFEIDPLRGEDCLKYMNATDAKYMAEYLKNFPRDESRNPEEIRIDSLGHIYFVPYGKVGKIVFDKEIPLWPMILNGARREDDGAIDDFEKDLVWLSKYIGGELADVKRGTIPEDANATYIFDDGKQYPLTRLSNSLIGYPDLAPQALCLANNKVYGTENAQNAAIQQALKNDLINKCRANNYMGLTYSNVWWLIKNGYIVRGNGFREYRKNGEKYMTLRNKWGKVRNVRFNKFDEVIDQW